MSNANAIFQLLDKPTVLSQFCYADNITSIHPTPDGCAWISDNQSHTIVLVDSQGKVQQKVHYDSNVADISMAPNTNHLWFCCLTEKSISEVCTSSATPIRRFTTDDEPFYLCVTCDGNVVVGSKNKIAVHTADGYVLHKTTREESGIMSPASITECPVTGNIAVVNGEPLASDTDDINSWRSHIIVFDQTLNVKFHYRGEGIGGLTSDLSFGPNSIAYDSFGHLTIADYKRYTIELVSGTGEFIRTLHRNTGEQGALGIQTGNVLWAEMATDTGEWVIRRLQHYSG